MSVFSKKTVPMCSFCKHGLPCRGSRLIVCRKRGVVDASFSCRSFKYDPLERVPAAAPVLEKHEKSEFEF